MSDEKKIPDVRQFIRKATEAAVHLGRRSEVLVSTRVIRVGHHGYEAAPMDELPESDEDGNFQPYPSDHEGLINHLFRDQIEENR